MFEIQRDPAGSSRTPTPTAGTHLHGRPSPSGGRWQPPSPARRLSDEGEGAMYRSAGEMMIFGGSPSSVSALAEDRAETASPAGGSTGRAADSRPYGEDGDNVDSPRVGAEVEDATPPTNGRRYEAGHVFSRFSIRLRSGYHNSSFFNLCYSFSFPDLRMGWMGLRARRGFRASGKRGNHRFLWELSPWQCSQTAPRSAASGAASIPTA